MVPRDIEKAASILVPADAWAALGIEAAGNIPLGDCSTTVLIRLFYLHDDRLVPAIDLILAYLETKGKRYAKPKKATDNATAGTIATTNRRVALGSNANNAGWRVPKRIG